ncbi:type IV pilus secretin PilQ [Spongiibacter sp. KMU-166]|uniref:Type IV pilus secretin PilQ n=1 Tax=Spongiibacter thalassae TaxID=2721624 RepID=A0ABX1GJT7_9GAMM|nr:type IV pilus secretin PilQ [Spongiibacter thalassae]NKI19499.1 type IV pilus secretin PilQ [Spongiibacter thalassae]
MKSSTQKRISERRSAPRGSVKGLAAHALLLMSLLVPWAASAATLTDVQFNALQGGSFEARFTFEGPAPEVKGYTIEKPARIALDLVGATNQLGQKKYPLAYDNASSAVVLEGRDRTRVVLNLVRLASYETRIEGNQLVVSVGAGGSRSYLKEKYNNPVVAAATPAANSAVKGNSIVDLDFRRGDKGEGRLVIKLADDKADINVFVEGPRIKIDFSGVALPSNLQRRFDVGDFSTPVKLIDARMGEKGAKLSLEAQGEYDYLAYQTDNEYVVSVKPLTKEEVKERRKEFAYVGEKLSLNFQDIEVRSVLQLIADFTELNLVASDTVAGNITLRLQNVPWDQALELVLKTKGLDKRQIGNVLMVAPAAEIAERERLEIESQKQVEELAPLQSEFLRIRYADAAELFKLFKPTGGEGGDGGASKSILSPRGNVIVDERTNSLLITETAERLEEFRRLVSLIDVPVRQVQIEARVVRASSDFDRALGVRWGGAYVTQDGNEIYSANGTLEGDQATRNNFVDALTTGANSFTAVPGLVTDLGVPGAAGSFAVGYIGSDVLLNLELSALESKGRGEVVSQPRIVTGDKEPAVIKSGTEIPYPQSSASGETTIAFKEAVLKLDVTPIITPDDRIIMDLIINQDTVGDLVISTGLGGQVPTIDTTELQTRVLVSNGETVVLGGVYDQLDVESETKVPFLGDIPFIGRLFKSTTVTREKQETLIFITPRILADSLVD